MDLMNLSYGQVKEMAPPSNDYNSLTRGFRAVNWYQLLYRMSLEWRKNSSHSGHELVIITTRVSQPPAFDYCSNTSYEFATITPGTGSAAFLKFLNRKHPLLEVVN
ncbi:hypothetical protein TNCV_2486291 [Trichonephila clavipes]|uniref:Uncharacterized protein n=1 Tax=Trichonephila clavipes TaxID=2585209 RepID=A0A8X6VZU9_TRICX|nr:hypothetical protein TNCV_2486291 [Trichonephila clavipes]